MVQRITKRSLITGVIVILLMMVYSFAFCLYCFMGKFHLDTNLPMMWLTYGFTMAIFAIAFLTTVLAFERSDLRSRVFGVPIVIVGFGGIVIQIVVDAIIMLVGAFVAFSDKSWVFIAIPEAILIVAIIVMIIVRQAYRGLIEAVDKQQVKRDFTTELLIQIEMICKSNQLPKMDKVLSDLYETARYTDPVSVDAVVPVEDEITNAIELVKSNIATGDQDNAIEAVNKVKLLLAERALRLKTAKNK